jgi:hypothetical protein
MCGVALTKHPSREAPKNLLRLPSNNKTPALPMPYKIRKVPNKRCYSVRNTDTGAVKAWCTSLAKARQQLRLLQAVEHGYVPKRTPSRSGSKSARHGYIPKQTRSRSRSGSKSARHGYIPKQTRSRSRSGSKSARRRRH